jgi:hypothetical protein
MIQQKSYTCSIFLTKVYADFQLFNDDFCKVVQVRGNLKLSILYKSTKYKLAHLSLKNIRDSLYPDPDSPGRKKIKLQKLTSPMK